MNNDPVGSAGNSLQKTLAGAADIFLFGLACVYELYNLSDYETAGSIAVSTVMLAVWLTVAVMCRPPCFPELLKKPKYIAFAAFLLFYAMALVVSMGLTEGLKYLMGALIVFSPMFIYDYFEQAGKRGFSKFFVLWTFLIFVYLSIKALYYLQSNRGIARLLGSSSAYGYLGIGGGYKLAYGLCILLPALIYFIKYYRAEKRGLKLVLLCCAVLFFITVVKSDYTLAFLFVMMACVLALLMTNEVKTNALIIAVMLLVSVVFYMFFSDAFGYWLYNFAVSVKGYIGVRLQELATGILGLGVSADMQARLDDIKASFVIFLRNPVVGQGFFTGFEYSSGLVNLGQHSEWADALGKWGLFGAVPYFSLIFLQIKECAAGRGDRDARALTTLMLIVIAVDGLFNPMFFTAFFAVISVVIPGALRYFLKAGRRADDG